MNKSKIKWVIVFIFSIVLSAPKAQTPLNIKNKSGVVTSVVLSEINKLVFSAGTMTVIKKSGTNVDFGLNNIQYMNFNKITEVEQNNAFGITTLFPNPVIDRLNIRYESLGDVSILVDIINIEGKIIVHQTMKTMAGANYFTIPVNMFQQGIYLCRLNNGKKIEIAKFIKN